MRCLWREGLPRGQGQLFAGEGQQLSALRER
jgi:hypothetical protein